MARPPAPCGTPAAYRRHKRNGEPIDAACADAYRAARRAERESADDSADPREVVPLRGAFTAAQGTNIDARERLLANLQLVERAMEKITDADPIKIVQLSKRHSEIVAELVKVSGAAAVSKPEEADPFAFLGNAARGPAPAPRKQA